MILQLNSGSTIGFCAVSEQGRFGSRISIALWHGEIDWHATRVDLAEPDVWPGDHLPHVTAFKNLIEFSAGFHDLVSDYESVHHHYV